MAIIKIAEKKQNYVVLDKSCLEETTLSWGAKGLHAFLMGKPPNWEIRIAALMKCGLQKRDALYGYINQLIEAGYIKRTALREAGRYTGITYTVYEQSQLQSSNSSPEGSFSKEVEGKLTGDEWTTEQTVTELPETDETDTELPEAEKTETVESNVVETDAEKTTLVNNNINNNIYKTNIKNKQTTAKQPVVDIQHLAQPVKPKKPAAVFLNDAIIAEKLTPNQQRCISNFVTQNANILDRYGTAQELCQSLAAEILNPACFSKAGNDFSRKTNTIKKLIRAGRWRPIKLIAQAGEQQEQRTGLIKSLKAQIRAAELECHTWFNALSDPLAVHNPESYFASCQNQLECAKGHLKKLHAKIKQLIAGNDLTHSNDGQMAVV